MRHLEEFCKNPIYLESCRGLWAAVLLRALRDFYGLCSPWPSRGAKESKEVYRLRCKEYALGVHSEVKKWMEEKDYGIGGFGFVCSAVGLSPQKVVELAQTEEFKERILKEHESER